MGFKEIGESLDGIFKPFQKRVKRVKSEVRKSVRNFNDQRNAGQQAADDMMEIMSHFKHGRLTVEDISQLNLTHSVSYEMAVKIAKMGHHYGRVHLEKVYSQKK